MKAPAKFKNWLFLEACWAKMTETISDRFKKIQDRVAQAAAKFGRSLEDIHILAATKTRTVEEINQAIEAGIVLVGENRVQEATAKFDALLPTRKHFIGHLQTNKVKVAARLCDCIESVDSLRVAQAVDTEAAKLDKKMPILVEVNVGGEDSKFGIPNSDVTDFVKEISSLENISIQGLMTMPPFAEDPNTSRPYFKTMLALYNEFKMLPNVEAKYLSMGTSHDFEVAIEEGSNLIRLGTVLFGLRT